MLVLAPLLPVVVRDIWKVRRALPADLPQRPLEHPVFCLLSLIVLAVMILLFLFGELLPFQLFPPAVAIVAASLALLIIHSIKVESVDKVLSDVDWKTLLFLTCLFLMVEAFTRTGILHSLSKSMVVWFGKDLTLVGMVMLIGVAAASSVLANIPVVAAMVLLVKGYCVAAELVPEIALGPVFTDWPAATLPVFVAMMFAAPWAGTQLSSGPPPTW